MTCDAFVCKLHEARAVAEANAVSEAEAAERISDFAALKAQAAEAKAESEDELEQFIAGCEDEALEEAECRTRILALSSLTVAYRAVRTMPNSNLRPRLMLEQRLLLKPMPLLKPTQLIESGKLRHSRLLELLLIPRQLLKQSLLRLH